MKQRKVRGDVIRRMFLAGMSVAEMMLEYGLASQDIERAIRNGFKPRRKPKKTRR